MLIVCTQAIYLVVSIGMTIYVAQSLKQNGRVFLLRTFKEDEVVTDSITNLLVIGFYLINIGWVLLWTKFGYKPHSPEMAIEFITTKVGCVLLILGAMHFLNLRIFRKIQHKDDCPDRKKGTPLMPPTYPAQAPVARKE